MATKGRMITGARARFSINGQKVGYAQGVTIADGIEYFPAEVLDNIEVEEHVPLSYRVNSFTCRMFRIVGDTVKSKGWFPASGANADEHLTNILNLIESGGMSATIEDTRTSRNIAYIEGVKMASNNWTIDRGAVSGVDVEFVAIRVRDESEVP